MKTSNVEPYDCGLSPSQWAASAAAVCRPCNTYLWATLAKNISPPYYRPLSLMSDTSVTLLLNMASLGKAVEFLHGSNICLAASIRCCSISMPSIAIKRILSPLLRTRFAVGRRLECLRIKPKSIAAKLEWRVCRTCPAKG